MSLHVDLKYASLLACHLEKFTRKGDYLFNFRCPLCGDSQTKKTKCRGYIYRARQRLKFKCHNCLENQWLGAIIKQVAPTLYKEYILETFLGTPSVLAPPQSRSIVQGPDTGMRFGLVEPQIYQHAEKISDLPEAHYCRQYVKSRQIPVQFWNKLYFTAHYKDFLDEVFPEHGKPVKDDARLVIPYYSPYGEVVAVTGRALENGNNKIRYVTVRAPQDTHKLIYGLDRVDQGKRVLVVEGPLDSLFLDNAVASGDANLIAVEASLSAAQVTLIYDNEKRNADIVRQMERAINMGHSVVIWPDWLKEKDINAMILAGNSQAVIHSIIHSHTYSGLRALVHLNNWKKTPSRKEMLV
jgi:hypothetical protein